jgi:hypothetical protein
MQRTKTMLAFGYNSNTIFQSSIISFMSFTRWSHKLQKSPIGYVNQRYRLLIVVTEFPNKINEVEHK